MWWFSLQHCCNDDALTNTCRLCFRRPPTVFEVIAELWNNPSFNPVAPPSECHLDFQLATDCSYDLVSGLVPATPQKVEDCFTSMRPELLCIITRWEQSGQGEGGRDQEAGLQEADQREHQRLFTPLIESVRDLAE